MGNERKCFRAGNEINFFRVKKETKKFQHANIIIERKSIRAHKIWFIKLKVYTREPQNISYYNWSKTALELT